MNTWLAARCRQSWEDTAHPDWPLLTVADVLQDERAQLLPLAQRFDGYIEQPVRVSHTALIHFQRNRYSACQPHT